MIKYKNIVRVITFLLAMLILASCAANEPPVIPDETTIPAEQTNTPEQTTEQTDNVTKEDTTVESTTIPATESSIETSTNPYRALNYDDFKAMWLSQYDLSSVYSTGSSQQSEKVFTNKIKRILSNVSSLGINTVIVQVRPNADSMYPSEYFPMSTYVVGGYGKEANYDPFEIIVKEAHELGLSVQAWINPLRAMLDTEIVKINDKYVIKQWYNDTSKKGTYIVLKSGRWYLNPAYEEVRQLIIDGAREILEKYDVDGLHMDDYFYPTEETSFDAKAYTAYVKGGGKLKVADWRREQLNLLVSGLWKMVKDYDPEVLFGISPAGNYDTVFNKQYADIYTWCGGEGYIDYICPQAYFGMEHSTWPFQKVVEGYAKMIKTDKVKLIVGMTLGKALKGYNNEVDPFAGSAKREWIEHRDILGRELEYTKTVDKCVGVAYFCYQYFYDPTTGAEVKGTAAERSVFLPILKEISWK